MPEDAILEALEADLDSYIRQAEYFMGVSKTCPPFEAVKMRREADKWDRAAADCKKAIAERRAQLGIVAQ